MIESILMSAASVIYIPELRGIVFLVILVLAGTATSTSGWIHGIVAIFFLFSSATISVWVLQLGWALAAVGVIAALSGFCWLLVQRSASHAGGLVLPGLGLLAAPFLNIFILMPALRQVIR